MFTVYSLNIHTQAQSEAFVNFLSRVEKLREALKMTKGEVYRHLVISPAMISMIRSEARVPGPKIIRRLEAAERVAGLAPPSKPGSSDVSAVREAPAVYGVAGLPTSGKTPLSDFQGLELSDLRGLLDRARAMVVELERIVAKASARMGGGRRKR